MLFSSEKSFLSSKIGGGSPRGLVANVLDFDPVVSELEHQSLYFCYCLFGFFV